MTESAATFSQEQSLPRVPIPDVDDSCERFLQWCAPLLTAEQFEQTRTAVDEFRTAPATAEVQRQILARDADPATHSWLDDFWPDRYLGRRVCVAINANFFFLFHPTTQSQVDRAVGLIRSAVDYKRRLDAEQIPVASKRGAPLSMVQNRFLFSTTRIPGDPFDTVRAPYGDGWEGPSPARHIIVIHCGRFYRLDVLDGENAQYSVEALTTAVAAIAADTRDDSAQSPGHLTTMQRAPWSAHRAELLRVADNAASFEEIESALFVVSLDDRSPADTQDAADLLLHGNSGNRWFDKSMTFIVFADGTAGVNVEHCGLDGTTVLNFVDAVLTTDPANAPSPEVRATQLHFELDATVIGQARDEFARFASDTATVILPFDDFGTERAKELGCSPDAFVQAAFQLAHQRAKGHLGATYESIAMRTYRHGRTEAMRVVTPEMVDFVECMHDPHSDHASRRSALQTAAAAHAARAKQCQSGQAPEQHLWELSMRGDRLGIAMPSAIYDSPGWTIMRTDYLSTSSAPSEHIQYFGFGSTSPQCIGIAYVLLPDRLNIYLSTPRAVAEHVGVFARELRAAITELTDLLS